MYRLGLPSRPVNTVSLDSLVLEVAKFYKDSSAARFAINDFRDALRRNGYIISKQAE